MKSITVKGTTFEILKYTESHSITRVITKSGYQYEGTWAGEPTLEEVMEEWKTNKRSFDRKSGCYGV